MNKIYYNEMVEGYAYFSSRKSLALALTVFLIVGISCRKLVDVPQPINSITDEAVYSNDASATSMITGMYVNMAQAEAGDFNGAESLLISAGLSADELFLQSGLSGIYFFQNKLTTGHADAIWDVLYNYIYRCNAAIEGIAASKTLTQSIAQQLLGETYFLRAFYYFYLINLFGPVPLSTTTDYTKNTLLSRAPVTDVYQLIIDDLKRSQNLLSEQYLNGSVNSVSVERVRPSKWAATALLARVYLYNKNYNEASEQASLVLNNSTLFSMPPLKDVFTKDSREAIWQLQPVDAFFNTWDARIFIIPSTGFDHLNNFYLNPSLVNSFELGDLRSVPGNWVDTINLDGVRFYYPFKYKDNDYNPNIVPENGLQFSTEYQMVLRLGEQYLIRAEALTQLGNVHDAIKDIDSIRYRAGLPLIEITNPGITKEELLQVILHERRVELFTEWGHRWFDLKRTDKVDEVMSVETPLKGGTWERWRALFPLGFGELQKAPNLTQNPGYTD